MVKLLAPVGPLAEGTVLPVYGPLGGQWIEDEIGGRYPLRNYKGKWERV